MKQYITAEQLGELSQKQRGILRSWWKPSFGDVWTLEENIPNGSSYFINPLTAMSEYLSLIQDNETQLPLLSIGQMIEFLDWPNMEIYKAKPPTQYMKKHHPDRAIQEWIVHNGDYENAGISYNNISICDSLWEAVKDKIRRKRS